MGSEKSRSEFTHSSLVNSWWPCTVPCFFFFLILFYRTFKPRPTQIEANMNIVPLICVDFSGSPFTSVFFKINLGLSLLVFLSLSPHSPTSIYLIYIVYVCLRARAWGKYIDNFLLKRMMPQPNKLYFLFVCFVWFCFCRVAFAWERERVSWQRKTKQCCAETSAFISSTIRHLQPAQSVSCSKLSPQLKRKARDCWSARADRPTWRTCAEERNKLRHK